MADQIQEILDVPREFIKDGVQFMNRAQKRTSPPSLQMVPKKKKKKTAFAAGITLCE